jgi:hypothetical protein
VTGRGEETAPDQAWLPSDPVRVIGHSPAAKVTAGVRFPLLVFAVWRVLHGIVVLALGGSLRKMTFAWDGGWYLSILHSGYVVPAGGYGQESNAAFFPGLPWVTQVVRFVVRQETGATLLVANALALAAFVTVWGAVRAWVDEAMARRATVALALFPTSYFLWMYYTEALFIAGTAAAVWAGRRKRHNLATALLVIASTARLVGVTLGPALALARIVRLRRVDSVCVRYVLGSLVGLGAVMARQAVEIGDPFGWLKAGRAWGREFAGPWTALHQAGRWLAATLPGNPGTVLLDALAVVLFGGLVALLWGGVRRGRWPLEAATVATPLWLVPICSQLIFSQARYMLACWPALLVVADAWPRLPRAVRVAGLTVPALLTFVLLRRLSQGMFTG